MAGYPPKSGYPYGAPPNYGPPPQPYGAPPPPPPPQHQSYASAPPYGGPPASVPYAVPYSAGEKPPKEGKAYDLYAAPSAPPAYGYGSAAPSAPYGGEKPPKEGKYQDAPGYPPQGGGYGHPTAAAPGGYGMPFASLVPPTGFPPGTDPNVVACFQAADADGSGFIDDKELQQALSSYNQTFSMRTVHLLMHLFVNSNASKIGPKEFTSLFYSLQNWRAIFERFDRDRSGRIEVTELRDALLSLGFAVSQPILDLLVSKFDKSGGKAKAIEYDNFIECCLIVKGLTEKFREKDTKYSGSATFTYESFMLTVLPFLIA